MKKKSARTAKTPPRAKAGTARPQALDPLRIVDATFASGATNVSQLAPPTLLEVAFAGRSNVGKSSLMNALCGRRNLVNTSSTPGCTRQISFFDVRTADDVRLTLVDLPGYGYAKRSKSERQQWAELIEGYLLERPTLRVVVSLVDVRRGPEADDQDLLNLLHGEPRTARPALSVLSLATKLDKLPHNQRGLTITRLRQSMNMELHGVSTELPNTQVQAWRRIRGLLGLLPTETPSPQKTESAAF